MIRNMEQSIAASIKSVTFTWSCRKSFFQFKSTASRPPVILFAKSVTFLCMTDRDDQPIAPVWQVHQASSRFNLRWKEPWRCKERASIWAIRENPSNLKSDHRVNVTASVVCQAAWYATTKGKSGGSWASALDTQHPVPRSFNVPQDLWSSGYCSDCLHESWLIWVCSQLQDYRGIRLPYALIYYTHAPPCEWKWVGPNRVYRASNVSRPVFESQIWQWGPLDPPKPGY